MKRKLEIVTLIIIALILLVAVFVRRHMIYKEATDPRYDAALYYAHLKAVDDQTSEPVSIQIKWDSEKISPSPKGSGPSVIETHADKTVTVALVGKKLDGGLHMGIAADGYHDENIQLKPKQSGIWIVDSSKMTTEIRLRRTTRTDYTPIGK